MESFSFSFIILVAFSFVFVHTRIFESPQKQDEIPRKPRAASLNPNHKWPNATIPFVLDSQITVSEMYVLFDAMREIYEKTCVQFQEIKTDYNENDNNTSTPLVKDFILFQVGNPGSGCRSKVGRVGGKQTVTLEAGYCFNHGSILHELGHVMGFFHEHSRPDRDQFVTINVENIEKGRLPNYARKESNTVTTYGLPYDMHSIMHYPSQSPSPKDGSPLILIVAKNASITKIGPKRKLTDLDVQRIRLFYNTGKSSCGVSASECQKSGRFPCSSQNQSNSKNTNSNGGNVECINSNWVCDQQEDCTNGSDENEKFCAWKFTLYQKENYEDSGKNLTVKGHGETCINIKDDERQCDQLNNSTSENSKIYRCLNLRNGTSSVDSNGGCLYLFKEKDCRGIKTVLDPAQNLNTVCAPKLSVCRFGPRDLNSIQPCWFRDSRPLYFLKRKPFPRIFNE